jgi:hypothetical protein
MDRFRDRSSSRFRLLLIALLVTVWTGFQDAATRAALTCPGDCCTMTCNSGNWNQDTKTCGWPASGSCEFCELTCPDGPINR